MTTFLHALRLLAESQYLFWLWAIASLNLYRGWLTGRLTYRMPVFYLAVPTLFGFVLTDWLMDKTVFALVCWQRPQSAKDLVTTRMSRYRDDPEACTKWQLWVANFVCGLLNLFNFDSTIPHC